MTNIVDAVARAIYDADPRFRHWSDWEELDSEDPTRLSFIGTAFVAIEAYEKAKAASLEEYDEATVSDKSGNSYRVRFPKGQNVSVISVDTVRLREE